MQCMRCNHNIKLIMDGMETKDISWYITNYVAKKQQESSNVSALFAKRIAYHQKEEQYNSDLTQLNKQLMQQCANMLSCEQDVMLQLKVLASDLVSNKCLSGVWVWV